MHFKGPHTLHNLYDSHVHWFYTGQLASTWNLKSIIDPLDIIKTEIKSEYMRGEWITGFGWDETKWPAQFKVHRDFLDQLSVVKPIHLSRTDGHSGWVNTCGLQRLGFLDPRDDQFKLFARDIMIDAQGSPTGLLKESAHMHALFNLPKPSIELEKKFLLQGAEIFNRAGFTHIRDMTSNASYWSQNRELVDNPEFLLHTEHWFVCENIKNIVDVVDQLNFCKTQENSWMKVRGVKIFIDGSLGSETACLSRNYAGQNHKGQMIWNEEDIKKVFKIVWKNKLEIAFHVIGDEASHQVVQWAREVYAEGVQGNLHLEHVEILRPETIQNMKSLHIRCHLQPCHWWNDQKWLQERIGDLYPFSFPWESLRKAQVPFSFGSDSPIEPTGFISNLSALNDSAKKGIRKLRSSAIEFHIYPNRDAVSGWTKLIDDQIHSIGLGDKKRQFI